jgi:hypothetical protein
MRGEAGKYKMAMRKGGGCDVGMVEEKKQGVLFETKGEIQQ